MTLLIQANVSFRRFDWWVIYLRLDIPRQGDEGVVSLKQCFDGVSLDASLNVE
jgi:hypothetical protein